MDTPLPLATPLAAPTPWRGRLPLIASLLALYSIWSSTYLALRVLVEHLPVFLAAGGRYVLAGALLAGVLRARGAPWPTARQWGAAAPVGALLFLVGNGFVALAERTASSGAAAVACATTPLWASVFGRWFGQTTTRREWAGVGLGLLGVLALSASEARGTPLAMGLLALAPVGWALGSLLSRRLPLAPGLMSAATQMITGGLCMVGLGLLRGEALPADAPARAWVAFGYLVVFGSLVAFSAYNYLLRTARPTVAMSYAYVNPALAVALGAVFGGETVGPAALLATALIVAGVAALLRPGK